MTTLAIGVLGLATLGYVLWPVFRPGPPPLESVEPPLPPAQLEPPLPLEKLEPPAGER